MEGLVEEVRPLGIRATIIEPGFFKTDFLDGTSVAYGAYDIEDYREAVRTFTEWHHDMNHQQVGDPAKLGGVLIELTNLAEAPVRFAAGSDAAGIIEQKGERIRAGARGLAELSARTDGDE